MGCTELLGAVHELTVRTRAAISIIQCCLLEGHHIQVLKIVTLLDLDNSPGVRILRVTMLEQFRTVSSL